MAITSFFGEIYVHTNLLNGKSYVGQSSRSMLERWSEHIRHANSLKSYSCSTPFARALRKYSPAGFESQVLAVARTKAEMDNLERVWIILLQTRTAGYNITAGGEGNLGLSHGMESRAKMAEAKLGNKHCAGRQASEETRAKLSAAIAGRTLTSVWKQKIAAAARGKVHSPETRAKIAAANRGRQFTAEHRKNLSVARQHRGGA